MYYHYEECGLDNVRLINGYQIKEIDGREVLFIQQVEQLHRVIGRAVARSSDVLGKAEIRFLRKELDLSQKDLGELLGVTDQTIALWENEKRVTNISKGMSALLKIVYLQSLDEEPNVLELLDATRKLTDLKTALLNLELRGSNWKPAKSAVKHNKGGKLVKLQA